MTAENESEALGWRGTGRRLPVLATALEAGELLLARAGTLLACFWLPWLLGTVAVTMSELWFGSKAPRDWAPDWLIDVSGSGAWHAALARVPDAAAEIVWAPFSAMISVMVLKTVLHNNPPPRAINLDFSRATALVIPVLLARMFASIGLDLARDAVQEEARQFFIAPGGDLDRQTARIAWHMIFAASWPLYAVVVLATYGLVAIVVDTGRLDWRANVRLVAQAPFRLLSLILLVGALMKGLEFAWGHLRLSLGLYTPIDNLTPKLVALQGSVVNALASFPNTFISYMVCDLTLALAYRRLAPGAGIISRGTPHPSGP